MELKDWIYGKIVIKPEFFLYEEKRLEREQYYLRKILENEKKHNLNLMA